MTHNYSTICNAHDTPRTWLAEADMMVNRPAQNNGMCPNTLQGHQLKEQLIWAWGVHQMYVSKVQTFTGILASYLACGLVEVKENTSLCWQSNSSIAASFTFPIVNSFLAIYLHHIRLHYSYFILAFAFCHTLGACPEPLSSLLCLSSSLTSFISLCYSHSHCSKHSPFVSCWLLHMCGHHWPLISHLSLSAG